MSKRSYRQKCNLAMALDVIGERWTLLIIRELLISPRRYSELLDNLPGIGTNLLSNRLRELENRGLVEQAPAWEGAGRMAYRLTAAGAGLQEAVHALVRWAASQELSPPESGVSRPEWDIVAMRALFRPEAARDVRRSYQLEIDGVSYFAHVDNGKLNVNAGRTTTPDLVLKTDRETLTRLHQGLPLGRAEAEGRAEFWGDRDALEHFLRMFQ